MKIKLKAGLFELQVYPHFLFRLLGFSFIALGFVFLLPMLVQYQIICKDKAHARANDCVLRTSFLKVMNKDTHLGELRSAIEVNQLEGDTVVYFLALNTSEGLIKISSIHSKKNLDIVNAATRVKSYIQSSLKNSIKLPKIESWWSYFKVFLFASLGFCTLLFRLITITISKKTNNLTIAAKNIINTHETKIRLADVEQLVIKEYGHRHKEYGLFLMLKNGELIDLPGVHDSNLQTIENIDEQIKAFLGIED